MVLLLIKVNRKWKTFNYHGQCTGERKRFSLTGHCGIANYGQAVCTTHGFSLFFFFSFFLSPRVMGKLMNGSVEIAPREIYSLELSRISHSSFKFKAQQSLTWGSQTKKDEWGCGLDRN